MPPRRRKAGRSRITLTMDTNGPLFEDGKPTAVIHKFLDETKEDAAQEGYRLLQDRFASTFKHPTGRYAKRVIIDRAGKYNDQVITDQGPKGGALYGPWLEGTGSRNKTTRFKGYKNFRKIRLWLRKQVTPMAQEKLDRYLEKLS